MADKSVLFKIKRQATPTTEPFWEEFEVLPRASDFTLAYLAPSAELALPSGEGEAIVPSPSSGISV